MRREQRELGAHTVIGYGHAGRAVLVFPSEQGRAWDYENNGMVGAVADLVDSGRVRLYCVDSGDAQSWSDNSLPIEERARRHGDYERWVLEQAVPWIHDDSGTDTGILTTGCSLGAYHAANFALKHAHVFPQALCLSGSYNPMAWHAWGEPGDATYFNNPIAYVSNLHGEHLDWLNQHVFLLLVVGQGAWETHPTQALPSTVEFAARLAEKDVPHELDLWGYDVPHDWPSWRNQLRHHLPRFC